MSSTESQAGSDVSVRLAGELFDVAVDKQAQSKRARGEQAYFPLQRDGAAASYFVAPDVKRMSAADFELPGGGEPHGLIDALCAYWAASGEAELAASMVERMKPIADALSEETANDDGSVDILCYTLF